MMGSSWRMMMRLWEEASDNRRKWSNVVRKILIVCVISSQGCWMTSQSQSSLQSKSVSTIHVCVSSPLQVTTAAPRPRLLWCWAPTKMSISQVAAGYFSRAGRGAAAAPGHLTITYHASSADLLPLSWSSSRTGALSGDPTVSLTRTMSPLALLLVLLGVAYCSAQAASSAKLQSLLGNTGAK